VSIISLEKDYTKDTVLNKQQKAGQNFVVLGGGIAGLTTAHELLKKGCSLVLLLLLMRQM